MDSIKDDSEASLFRKYGATKFVLVVLCFLSWGLLYAYVLRKPLESIDNICYNIAPFLACNGSETIVELILGTILGIGIPCLTFKWWLRKTLTQIVLTILALTLAILIGGHILKNNYEKQH